MMFIIGLNSWETWKIVEDGRKERVGACFAYCQKTCLPSLYFRICGALVLMQTVCGTNLLSQNLIISLIWAPPALLS